jgi:hypothetical protein
MKYLLTLLAFTILITGCSPEIGSKKWCDNLEAKAKGDWTVNEATDYAKNCILK